MDMVLILVAGSGARYAMTFQLKLWNISFFSCNALRDIRYRLLYDLMDSMPAAMKTSFSELSCKSKLEFIISGLGSETYIPEWQGVYANACSFIHALYRERAAMYKRLDVIVS